MANKPRDTEKPKTETEKKQVETVHLTAEELRKISGGTGPSSILPQRPHSHTTTP
jgi:hypothetical protein